MTHAPVRTAEPATPPTGDVALTRPKSEFLDRFTRALEQKGCSASVRNAHRNSLSWFLAFYRGAPHAATAEDVTRFLVHARERGVGPVRERSLRRALALAYGDGVGRELAPADATREPRVSAPHVEDLPPARAPGTDVRPAVREVMAPEPIIEAEPDPSREDKARRAELARTLSIQVGLEAVEIAGLTWADLDLVRGAVRVAGPPGRVPRWILVPDAALGALAVARRAEPQATGFVFPDREGAGHVSARTLQRLLSGVIAASPAAPSTQTTSSQVAAPERTEPAPTVPPPSAATAASPPKRSATVTVRGKRAKARRGATK